MAQGIKSRYEDLKASIERMSARERMSVGLLVGVVLLLIGAGVSWLIWSRLDEIASRNEELRQALKDLAKHRGTYQARAMKRRALERAIPKKAGKRLELNSYVDKAAQTVGVKIDQYRVPKTVPGTKFTPRSLEIKLRQLDIGQVASLIKRLEISSNYLVQVTELNVNTRYGRQDQLDLEIVVTTYDRTTKRAKPKKKRKRREKSG